MVNMLTICKQKYCIYKQSKMTKICHLHPVDKYKDEENNNMGNIHATQGTQLDQKDMVISNCTYRLTT